MPIFGPITYLWVRCRRSGGVELRPLPSLLWARMEGHEGIPATFVSNGCTLSPDRWDGFALWPACHVHDWDYLQAGGIMDRARADARLRRNLVTLMENQGAGALRARRLAWAYWAGVRVGGPLAWWV